MQTAAIAQAMQLGQATTPTGVAQGSTAQGGDFMQLIMQMMGQGSGNADDLMSMMGGDNGTTSMDELLGLTGKQEDDEEDTDYLMQLMAGMLGHGMPQIAMYNSGEPATKQSAETAAMEILSAVQSKMSTAGDGLVSGSAQYAMWSTGTKTGVPTDISTYEILSDGRVVQNGDLLGKSAIPVEILTEGYNKNGQPATIAVGDPKLMQDLIHSMGKPQQPVVQAVDAKKQEIIDIDALQQVVDSGRYLAHGTTATQDISSANPQTMDILAQVKTGILANMDKGSSEFVIKLKPEGLGEITVKMTEVAGKVSLSIITANQSTQNALAGEISSLREALRPYNAEVSQVITQQDANLSQGFGEHKHGQQQEQQDSRYGWMPQTADDPQQSEYVSTLASALNEYI